MLFQVQDQLKITFRMRTLKIKYRSSQDTADKPVLLTVIDMEITTFSATFKPLMLPWSTIQNCKTQDFECLGLLESLLENSDYLV